MGGLKGKDISGKDLEIGDKVAFTRYADEIIRIGVISKEVDGLVYVYGNDIYDMVRLKEWEGKSSRIIKI